MSWFRHALVAAMLLSAVPPALAQAPATSSTRTPLTGTSPSTAAPTAPATHATTPAAKPVPKPGGGPGLVWVNSASKVYHCQGSRYYGTTKQGSYMSETAAKAAGNHAAQNKGCS